MKILFVVRDLYKGGAGKQLSLIAEGLLGHGHAVSIYTYIGKTDEWPLNERITYIYDTPIVSKLQEYSLTPIRIRRVVNRIKPDVVISWRANAGCWTVLGCLGAGVRVVFSERTDPFSETNLMLKLATKVCCFSDAGVFQLPKIRDFYKRIRKSVVIHNIVVAHDYEILPISKRKNEIVWVGRLANAQKRMDVAIRAFAEIHKKHPELLLSIYGDGPDKEDTKLLIKSMGLSDFVIFHGMCDNVIEKIRYCKLLLFSSDYEGIPNVILEAFDAGLPVVATDCKPGGARELIKDSENGYIVPTGDYVSLSRMACVLLDQREIAESFVIKSKNKLANFSAGNIVDQWNQFLSKL